MSSKIQLDGVYIIDLLRASERSFFRVEAFDSYNAPSEVGLLKKYYDGDPLPPPWDGSDEWFKLMSLFASKRRPTQRVRVISRRLAPYVRFEMDWGYNHFLQFGEEFNVIIREQFPDLNDTWDAEYFVIDDRRVVYIKYDETHRMLGLEEELDAEEVKRRVNHKYQLLEKSTHYGQFLSQLRKNGVVELPYLAPNIAGSLPHTRNVNNHGTK